MKENGLTIGYEDGMISISYNEGCENIGELIAAVKVVSTNPKLIIR
jgi:hypothetical protein